MKKEPNLGDVVYLVFEGEIYERMVYAKGKYTFFCDDYKEVKEDYVEHKYDSFGETWFFDFDSACEKALSTNRDKRIIQGANDWWYLE